MREQQSLANLKRQEWRIEIRKKEINDYFQKRRHEMIGQTHIRNSKDFSDTDRCSLVMSLINHFCYKNFHQIVSQIVQIDTTLSTFYHLTNFNPQSPPIFFQNILSEIIGCQIEEKIIREQIEMQKVYTTEEKYRLKQIWNEMQSLWNKQSKNYISILSAIKRVDNTNLLIRAEIVTFLSTILNILLIAGKVASILGIELFRNMLVGQEIFMNYQIQTTTIILFNLLSGDDKLLIPILNDFLQTNGCSTQLIGLYFNMFLIKDVSFEMRIKIFQYFARLLQNNRDYFLDNHKDIVYTLFAALKVTPPIQDKKSKQSFVILAERVIKLISQLLTVINMRFQTFSISLNEQDPLNQEDHLFLYHMAWILDFFSSTGDLVRNIMEANSITLFILNHLTNTQSKQELKVIALCLNILVYAAKDHHSIHYFLNQEPRLLLKIMSLFQKYLNVDYKHLNVQQSLVLKHLLFLMSDLSQIERIAEKFLQQGFLCKIGSIYFHIQGYSSKQKQIRESAEILYLNLLAYLKNSSNNLEIFYQFLFDEKATYFMLINMLKLTPQKKRIVSQALTFLSFIVYNCTQVSQFSIVRQMLLQSILSSQLAQLQNCDFDDIAQKATYIVKTIRNIRYVRHSSECLQNYYQQEQLL